MMNLITLFAALFLTTGCTEKKTVDARTTPDLQEITEISARKIKVFSAEKNGYIWVEKVNKSLQEWKQQLDPRTYEITRLKGTEKPYDNKYVGNHDKGIFACACCGNDLFTSDTKFESGTGWPSFFKPIAKENITTNSDHELGYERTEVLCARCGAHLGHVFDDGPKPTGLRYCMNSVAMDFKKQ